MTWFKLNKSTLVIVIFTFICTQTVSQASVIQNKAFSGIINFGEPNTKILKKNFHQLDKKSDHVMTITLFGDSHSASDFFTGELRTLLQTKYGNAGIGWVTPMHTAGQYHSEVTWKSSGWQLVSSRTMSELDFPMGGYIANPIDNGGYIEITPQNAEINSMWENRLIIKPLNNFSKISISDVGHKLQQIKFTKKNKMGKWQIIPIKMQGPFIIKANKNEVEIGGIWLQRYRTSGVIVSMTGTNGAKQSIWQKWSPNWYKELAATKSDIVILEYGTNETFEEMIDLNEYYKNLVENIQKIRKTLPKAVVLVISPPDTMSKTAQNYNLYERRPPNYYKIRQIQQEVAKQQKTLYWDWQTAMGGEGMIEKWYWLDLARPDFIHLTKKGYIESAKTFYNDLMIFIK